MRCALQKTQKLAAGMLLAVLAWGACDRGGDMARSADAGLDPVVTFEVGTVRIEAGADTLELRVELAEREDQRAHGLMERDRLDPDAGMLFRYDSPQDGESGFWMYRTRIPLDIAFMDQDGRIVAIEAMEPCPSPNPRLCRIYSPGVGYSSALEVNRGYFAQHGVEIGHRVVLVR